jgi:protein-disulfide isomerase
MTRSARRLLTIAAVGGFAASATSTYVHYQLLRDPTHRSFCDVNATVSCTQAYLSKYGSVAGVPVALAGALFFALVLLLLFAERRSRVSTRENVPAYLFALSTLALAAVLYLGWAAFAVLKTFCILCAGTYVAVIVVFLVSGAATSLPMTSLPRRAMKDVRALVTTPAALAAAILFLVAASTAIIVGARHAVPVSDDAAAPSAGGQSEFERWYTQQPRQQIPVPDDGAKVVIVKFNDYQCPPCRQTFMQYKSILARYQADQPGRVKFVTRDYPLDPECNKNIQRALHAAACEAAVAVRLAREKNQADRMEQWLFDSQELLRPQSSQEGRESIKSRLREIAGVADFDARYASTLEAVKADVALGALLGVTSTPTFYINGVKVEGGLPPKYFEEAIQYELKRSP